MNTHEGYAKRTLSADYVLLANGGEMKLGNASGDIPVSNGTVNTNLNADLLDGSHGNRYFKILGWNSSTAYSDADNVNDIILGMITNQQGSSSSITNYPTSYGYMLSFIGQTDTKYSGLQFYESSGHSLSIRSKWGDDWGSWRTIIDSSNYTSYINNYYWANLKISSTANYGTTPYVKYLYFKKNGDNTAAGWVGAGSSANDDIALFGYAGSGLTLGTNGSARLYINTSGNVGIGTTSPSYKLDINGGILAITNQGITGGIGPLNSNWFHFTLNNDVPFYFNKPIYVQGMVCPSDDNSYSLGNDTHYWYTVKAGGFYKKNSSNNYVLLGGGGHKALSDFSMTHSHPYLPLAGGTMTGTIHREYSESNQTPFIWINGSDYDNYIWQIGSGTTTKQYYGYALKYIGTGNGEANYLRLYADNQGGTDVIAIGINQSGQVGIGNDANTSYRLYVNGSSMFKDIVNIDSNAMGAATHINFNRANFNYINVPTNGKLAISINGASEANTFLAVNSSSVYPGSHNNSITLGTTSYRWSKVYIGSANSYGSATQPIYWNAGVPAATTYSLSATIKSGTANRMAWYDGNNSITSATNIYTNGSKLGINQTSATEALDVNGNGRFIGNVYPSTSNARYLGTSSYYWNGAYINGNGNIHWNNLVKISNTDITTTDTNRGLPRILANASTAMQQCGNRFYGLSPESVTIEYTTNNGSSWTTQTTSTFNTNLDTYKRYLTQGHWGTTAYPTRVGNVADAASGSTCSIAVGMGTRVTLDMTKENRTGYIECLSVYYLARGHTYSYLVERQNKNSGTWTTIEEGTLSSNALRTIYPATSFYLSGNSTSTSAAYANIIRITMIITAVGTAQQYAPMIGGICGLGSGGVGQTRNASYTSGRRSDLTMAQWGVPIEVLKPNNAVLAHGINWQFYGAGGWIAANTNNYADVYIGNSSNKNAANEHAEGRLFIYSAATHYHLINTTSTTTHYTHTLPNGSGWLVTGASAGAGSATKPVYLTSNGILDACSYTIGATIDQGTTNRMAWYKGANEIASTSTIYASDTALTINGTSAPENNGKFQVIGTSTMQDVYPKTTATYNLGSTSLRWAKLYIGGSNSYGSETQPIYWNDGVPVAITYSLSSTVNSGTANRMAYYDSNSDISAATSIYATTDALSINRTSAPANSGKFQVVGTSTMRHIYPEATETYTLGTSSLRWKGIYSGTGNFTGQVTSSVADGTAPFVITSKTVNTNLNADMVDGLHIHTGTNNEANKLVRTNANGYILAGWVSTTSGDMGDTDFTKVYVSNDNYIRYVTRAKFASKMFGNVSANTVFAGPTSGSAASPTFRSLVQSDIPTLPDQKITWGDSTTSSMSLIDNMFNNFLRPNRFAGLKAEGITVEYSIDSGSTWTTYSLSDLQKRNLFTNRNTAVKIGGDTVASDKSGFQLRITIDTGQAGIYTTLYKIQIYISTNYSQNCKVTIKAAYQSNPTNYTKTICENQAISGQSGWNEISIPSGITTYGNTASSQYGRIQFTFTNTGLSDTTKTSSGLLVQSIFAYGGMGWTTPSTLALSDHLYQVSGDLIGSFPNYIESVVGFRITNSINQARVYYSSHETYLELGNNKATTNTYGARGRILLYNTNTFASTILSAAASNQSFWIPAYDGVMYAAHIGSASAVGSGSTPVYVAANGRITQCTSTFLTSHQTIKQDGIIGATANHYATCNTAAATAAKTGTAASGTITSLESGLRVIVNFADKNMVANPTFNLNNLGAKNITLKGTNISANTAGVLHNCVELVYTGSVWEIVNYDIVSTTNIGCVPKTSANAMLYANDSGVAIWGRPSICDISILGNREEEGEFEGSIGYKGVLGFYFGQGVKGFLDSDGININHQGSPVTPGTYGTSKATSGTSITIPYFTVDPMGHLMVAGTHTHTVSTTDTKVTQTATTTSANYEILFSNTADNTTRTEEARKTSTLLYNPSTKLLQNDGPLFLRPGSDSTLKIYSGKVTDAYSDGFIKLQTSIDGTDGETHANPTNYQKRCALFLQPRGGEVYIGKDITAASTYADTNYKLNVGGAANFDGDVYADNFRSSSDARLKYEIERLSEHIYKFKFNGSNVLNYGFIAQELEKEHPELVEQKEEFKTVNYNSALSLYISELENKYKELQETVIMLKKEIYELKQNNK